MGTERLDALINEAHAIFNKTSIYEVIDLINEQAAKDFLRQNYSNPGENSMDQYLAIVDRIVSL